MKVKTQTLKEHCKKLFGEKTNESTRVTDEAWAASKQGEIITQN